jgi:hypothetical protein
MGGTCYVRPDSGIDLGKIALRVLREMEWSQKQAALCVRTDYEPVLSRGLAGLGPLDIHALACLPGAFWWKFFRETIRAVLLREEAEQEQERKRA